MERYLVLNRLSISHFLLQLVSGGRGREIGETETARADRWMWGNSFLKLKQICKYEFTVIVILYTWSVLV